MLSFVQPGQFWLVFMTQGLLVGLSISFGVQPALTVVGQHFKERRALAMGLVSTGSAFGGIGFPLMFGQLLPRVGFAVSLRLAALKVVCVKERKKKSTSPLSKVRKTDIHSVCYVIALCVCTGKPSKKPGCKDCTCRIDFSGFLDPRYAVLCVGTWFAILGLWLPAYYISE
jgi:MCP family monocarboxylic acid transporter-like MFS transporter 10